MNMWVGCDVVLSRYNSGYYSIWCVLCIFVVDAYGVVWFPGRATPKPKRLSPGTIDLDW